MKTTEKVLGMVFTGLLFLISGLIGFVGMYLTNQPCLAYLMPFILILCGILELAIAFNHHKSYAKHPELRKKDEVGARDERTLLIRLKSINASSAGILFVGIIFIQVYGIFISDFLDVLFTDTLTLIRTLFVSALILWLVLYGIAYFIFQRIN